MEKWETLQIFLKLLLKQEACVPEKNCTYIKFYYGGTAYESELHVFRTCTAYDHTPEEGSTVYITDPTNASVLGTTI
jgi:hypothetical protein